MRNIRHHLNPCLKIYCPNIYRAFRKSDCIVLPNDVHAKYHRRLDNSNEFYQLLASADELASNDTSCDEFLLANKLDLLWKHFLAENPQFQIR